MFRVLQFRKTKSYNNKPGFISKLKASSLQPPIDVRFPFAILLNFEYPAKTNEWNEKNVGISEI